MADRNTTRNEPVQNDGDERLTGPMLTELRKRYVEHIAQLRNGKCRLLAFSCPDCGKEISTLAPEDNVCWDTHSTCPWCGKTYLKQVRRDQVNTFIPADFRKPYQGRN